MAIQSVVRLSQLGALIEIGANLKHTWGTWSLIPTTPTMSIVKSYNGLWRLKKYSPITSQNLFASRKFTKLKCVNAIFDIFLKNYYLNGILRPPTSRNKFETRGTTNNVDLPAAQKLIGISF